MDINNRITENFPSVLLTLLSIVQAIALEELWGQLQASTYLYEATWLALLGGLQMGLSLLTIILIWLLYVGLVLHVRFTPTALDAVLPFFIGLIQFLLVAMATPETLGQWTIVFAMLLGIVNYINHKTMRRARQEAHNDFFKNVSPATTRNFLNRGFFIVTFLLAGIWLYISGDHSWIALTVLLVILGRLSYIFKVVSSVWRVTGEEN